MIPAVLMLALGVQGGAIVSSNECSEMEIADARATGRFAVDQDGYGFVRRTKEWLHLQQNRAVVVESAAKDAMDLCHRIEACGCSPDLTEASVQASVLHDKLTTMMLAPAAPKSHQQRVLDEKEQLDDRLTKLGHFIDSSPIFTALPDEERLRLVRQRACMSELSTILAERIEAFPS